MCLTLAVLPSSVLSTTLSTLAPVLRCERERVSSRARPYTTAKELLNTRSGLSHKLQAELAPTHGPFNACHSNLLSDIFLEIASAESTDEHEEPMSPTRKHPAAHPFLSADSGRLE